MLGVVIETAVTDVRGTHWYTIDGKTIADISFVYEEDSVIKPYDASGFQKAYGVQMRGKKEGITLFMQMTGLKLPCTRSLYLIFISSTFSCSTFLSCSS